MASELLKLFCIDREKGGEFYLIHEMDGSECGNSPLKNELIVAALCQREMLITQLVGSCHKKNNVPDKCISLLTC